jgi:hypothetical protein
MAVGDTTTTHLTVRQTTDVAPGETVQHFDELSERAQDRFLRLVNRGPAEATDATVLGDVDVVVFTDYYRISRR